MRYALIAVAIAASLFLGWLGGSFLLAQLTAPLAYPRNETVLIAVLGTLALIMAMDAIGLIRRQAWAAYLLSVVAFLSSPVIALLTIVASGLSYGAGLAGRAFIFLGAILAALLIGLLGLAVGEKLRRERAALE